MKLFIFAAVLALSACGASSPAQQDRALEADAGVCDPADCRFVVDGSNDPCPNDGSVGCRLVCPACGDGNICTSDGVCGAQCGNGNVSCDSTTICDLQSDCAPPCLVGGQVYVPPVGGNCAQSGFLTSAADLSCFVPCWSFVCWGLLGGSCG